MTALHREFQVVQRRRLYDDGVHAHTQPLTKHSGRIADTSCLVDHVARRRALNDGLFLQHTALAPALE